MAIKIRVVELEIPITDLGGDGAQNAYRLLQNLVEGDSSFDQGEEVAGQSPPSLLQPAATAQQLVLPPVQPSYDLASLPEPYSDSFVPQLVPRSYPQQPKGLSIWRSFSSAMPSDRKTWAQFAGIVLILAGAGAVLGFRPQLLNLSESATAEVTADVAAAEEPAKQEEPEVVEASAPPSRLIELLTPNK